MQSLERPPPTASGTFGQRPLVHLLVYALERKLAGSFEVQPPGAPPAWLVLAEGRPVKVDPSLGAGAPTERLDRLFGAPSETRFAFYEAFDGIPDEPAAALDPWAVIWRGLSRNPPVDHVRAAMAKLATARLRVGSGAAVFDAAFSEGERALLRTLQASALTPAEIAGAGVLAPERAELLCYALLITKRAEILAADATPAPAAAPEEPEEPEEPGSDSVVPPPPSSGSALGRVRLKQQPAGGPGAREEHARVSATDSRISRPQNAVDQTTIARAQEILARARAIDDENYFQMLGVSREATTSEVQASFLSLAKTWHPDRLPAALADVKDACGRVFARLSEAQATLVDPERRANYMRLISEGGATPKDQEIIAGVVEAITNFQKAEIFLKRGSVAEAEALCRKAVTLDPNQADYLALLAWIESMHPDAQSPEGTKSRVEMLDRALMLNDKCERAYFYRAMLRKRLNDGAHALEDFRRAAALNPRNVDAQREVRLAEMRSSRGKSKPPSKPPPDEKKGLFGRLFKK